MLYLVGLGLGGSKDVTERGRQAIAEAKYLFAETYTTMLPHGTLEELATSIDRKVDLEGGRPYPDDLHLASAQVKGLLERAEKGLLVLPRALVEQAQVLLAAARQGPTVLLVGGDPLSATTHTALRLEALKASVEFEVIPNSTILVVAPGMAGLDLYRFGRTTTLVLPEEGGKVLTSPLAMVKSNRTADLHTLVLCDIKADDPKANPVAMTANEALRLLTGPWGSLTRDSLVVVVARAGWPNCKVISGTAGKLQEQDFGAPPHCLLVPSRLGVVEEEALAALTESSS